jgi:hypothetical protein
MSTKRNPNHPKTFGKIAEAFDNPKPSPRPTQAEQVNEAYERGAQRYEKLTGKKPQGVPAADAGLENFPPAKKMLEGGVR